VDSNRIDYLVEKNGLDVESHFKARPVCRRHRRTDRDNICMSPSKGPCTGLMRRWTFLSALVLNASDQTIRSLPRALTAAVMGHRSSGPSMLFME